MRTNPGQVSVQLMSLSLSLSLCVAVRVHEGVLKNAVGVLMSSHPSHGLIFRYRVDWDADWDPVGRYTRYGTEPHAAA